MSKTIPVYFCGEVSRSYIGLQLCRTYYHAPELPKEELHERWQVPLHLGKDASKGKEPKLLLLFVIRNGNDLGGGDSISLIRAHSRLSNVLSIVMITKTECLGLAGMIQVPLGL